MSYQSHVCLRCGHEWGSYCYYGPRAEKGWLPKRCAGCRSPRWNKPVTEDRRRQSERLKGNDNWSGPTQAKMKKATSPAAMRRRAAKFFPGRVRRS